MNHLAYPQPVADPISIFLMRVVHEKLVVEHDFELSQTVLVEFYTNNDGALGVPVAEYFDADTSLSTEQRERLKRQYASYTRTTGTRGYMIDPTTHEIVPPSEDGTYPEGSVPEKMMWLTAGQLEYPEPIPDPYSNFVLKVIQSNPC